MTLVLKALGLLGLDITARLHSARAAVDLRIWQAKEEGRRVARKAIVVAVLGAIATLAVASIIAIGLAALYLRVSDEFGTYAGLGAMAAVLVVVAVVFAAATVARMRSVPHSTSPSSKARPAPATATTPPERAAATASPDAVPNNPAGSEEPARVAAAELDTSNLVTDVLTPLGILAARYITTPTQHPLLDEALHHFRTKSNSTAEDPIELATRTIREGDRTSALAMLAGAAFLGWALTKYPQE